MLADLGVNGVAIAAIAKGVDRDAGRETFFVAGKEPFRLPPRDPALYFVERLRDEAHRFAIGTHRARRKKDFTRSPLDEIAGVGPARKRALLHAFGTAKAISRAGLADLEKVAGINAATAKLVYDFFHDERADRSVPGGVLDCRTAIRRNRVGPLDGTRPDGMFPSTDWPMTISTSRLSADA